MATEVLRPQDCLIERIRVPPAAAISRRRSAGYYNGNPSSSCNYYYSYYNGNGNGSYNHANANANPRSSRRAAEQRKAPAASRRTASSDDLRAAKASPAEKVTILRRGESLDSKIKSEALKKDGNGGLAVCGTQQLGPDPEMVPRRLGIVSPASDVYAGSAFAVSPAPSSLPLPSFSKKKQAQAAVAAVDDSATRDLRRLLRIG